MSDPVDADFKRQAIRTLARMSEMFDSVTRLMDTIARKVEEESKRKKEKGW